MIDQGVLCTREPCRLPAGHPGPCEPEDPEPAGTVRWFGPSWHAPICEPRTHVETPVERRCARCEEDINYGDRGITLTTNPKLAWHLRCWLRELGVDGLVANHE